MLASYSGQHRVIKHFLLGQRGMSGAEENATVPASAPSPRIPILLVSSGNVE